MPFIARLCRNEGSPAVRRDAAQLLQVVRALLRGKGDRQELSLPTAPLRFDLPQGTGTYTDHADARWSFETRRRHDLGLWRRIPAGSLGRMGRSSELRDIAGQERTGEHGCEARAPDFPILPVHVSVGFPDTQRVSQYQIKTSPAEVMRRKILS